MLGDSISLIQSFPFRLNISLLCGLLLLLKLCLLHDMLIPLNIHLFVGSIHRECDGNDCLMPMLLLFVVEEASDNDWICYVHVSLNHLLHGIGVKKN